jgi:hypothetical protein
MVEKCPNAMLIQDKWGEVPLYYALLGTASIAVIHFLFMTHSKRWEALPFDFGNNPKAGKVGQTCSFYKRCD